MLPQAIVLDEIGVHEGVVLGVLHLPADFQELLLREVVDVGVLEGVGLGEALKTH